MFRSTKFVEFLASEWHMETPKEIRRKKHLFTAGKDPNPEKRITNILPFLERNGVKATASNVIQIINLCEHATKEAKRHEKKTINAFRHDLQIASCNWETCTNRLFEGNGAPEAHVADTATRPSLSISWIVYASKKWQPPLNIPGWIRLFAFPDYAQPFSRVQEVPCFLEDNGVSPDRASALIDLFDAAMARTKRVGSFFEAIIISLVVSFLTTFVSELAKDSSIDFPCSLVISVLAALFAAIMLIFILSWPKREWIAIARFKADLITAKANGFIS